MKAVIINVAQYILETISVLGKLVFDVYLQLWVDVVRRFVDKMNVKDKKNSLF